jgi:GTP-binding protein HflX
VKELQERAILVGLELKVRSGARFSGSQNSQGHTEESLEELAVLAESAGAVVLNRTIQSRPAPTAATLIGSGKVQELAHQAAAAQTDVIIFDCELTPTQQRNLERALAAKVIDRTQLILDLFARRARTREGQLQVELAQLNYLLPRLAGRGTQMSRLGGGIGTRGPGETQLETDRRRIFRRIRKIQQELESVRRHRGVQRRQRQVVPLATAALVGYTNAGKSTLFNRLTGADVQADARMFATLDPTIRAITLPSHRRILLSDTVGFIRNLPTTLVKAFRATLEEVTEAALLINVIDVASPRAAHQASHVRRVLAEIGSGDTPNLLVLNKIDLVQRSGIDAEAVHRRVSTDLSSNPQTKAVTVSAKTGQGLDRLREVIDEVLPSDPISLARFRFPVSEGAGLHVLHEFGRVHAKRYVNEYCEVEAEVSDSLKYRLAEFLLDRKTACGKSCGKLSRSSSR